MLTWRHAKQVTRQRLARRGLQLRIPRLREDKFTRTKSEVHRHSRLSQDIREQLGRWNKQRDYPGP